MAVSKAHIKASRKYENSNPERTGYNRLKRNAFNFVNALDNNKTKAYQQITSDYGKKHYKEDLQKIKLDVERHLKELEK